MIIPRVDAIPVESEFSDVIFSPQVVPPDGLPSLRQRSISSLVFRFSSALQQV